jgi:hypothetical protein
MAERASTHKGDRFAEPEADPAEVEAGWRDAAAIHETQALKEALRAAEQALEADPSEEALERITEIRGGSHALRRLLPCPPVDGLVARTGPRSIDVASLPWARCKKTPLAKRPGVVYAGVGPQMEDNRALALVLRRLRPWRPSTAASPGGTYPPTGAFRFCARSARSACRRQLLSRAVRQPRALEHRNGATRKDRRPGHPASRSAREGQPLLDLSDAAVKRFIKTAKPAATSPMTS